VVLKLLQSCIGAEIATGVVGFAVAEVVVPDLGNVGSIGGLCNVYFARIDEFLEVVFVSFSPGLYGGGNNHGQAAVLIYGSGKGVGWLLSAARAWA
jgi:hypothetical protein